MHERTIIIDNQVWEDIKAGRGISKNIAELRGNYNFGKSKHLYEEQKMGNEKYEVTYYNWMKGEELTELWTNSLLKALWTVHQLHKEWYCVSIKSRKDDIPRVKKGVATWRLPSKG